MCIRDSYYVTDDDRVIMASEAGVLDIPPERVRHKGRLEPGRLLLVDTVAGRIVADDELKERIAAARPYGEWLATHLRPLAELPDVGEEHAPDHDTVTERQHAFGYTFEDLRMILAPMARDGVEPLGSMGDDTPVAVLSERPQDVYKRQPSEPSSMVLLVTSSSRRASMGGLVTWAKSWRKEL